MSENVDLVHTSSHKTFLQTLLAATVVVLATSLLYPYYRDESVKTIRTKSRQAADLAQTSTIETKSKLLYEHHSSWGSTDPMSYLEHLDENHMAPLTKEAQRWIYERQFPNPKECRSKDFIIAWGHEGSGLGSIIHMAGIMLGHALEANKILLWQHNFGHKFTNENCNFNCLFESISSCTLEDTNDKNSVEWPPGNFAHIPAHWGERLQQHFAPRVPTHDYLVAWWRVQSVAYLSRLNRESLGQIKLLRSNESLHIGWIINPDGSKIPQVVPFPLPAGTISAHVRHGDKASEMTLVDFKEYAAAAEHFGDTNPHHYQHKLFVSTEDPTVIEEAQALVPSLQETRHVDRWEIYYSDIGRINGSPFVQLDAFGRQNTTYIWFLQLLMALECDAWVGTRGSNWNRLIDELRCVWIDKCQLAYLEVGPLSNWGAYQN